MTHTTRPPVHNRLTGAWQRECTAYGRDPLENSVFEPHPVRYFLNARIAAEERAFVCQKPCGYGIETVAAKFQLRNEHRPVRGAQADARDEAKIQGIII